MSTIQVKLPDAAYGVQIRPGLLKEVGEVLNGFGAKQRCALVTDTHVAPLYLDDLSTALARAGLEVIPVVLEAGEQHKNLASVSSIYDALLGARVERSTPVIGLGGGVITDMAGFAAATVLRGVPYVPMPTSLLAMVDASVGGKTGVNHAAGKNLIGAFHHPKTVLIDPAVLTSLPEAHLRGGLAECIKHDIIRDADGFACLEQDLPGILNGDVDLLSRLVEHNVGIKARVVEADPYEHGERAHLNFGHTFAHAFEKVSRYALSHGDAVAAGMCAAMEVSVALQMVDEATRDRVHNLVTLAGLPTKGLGLDVEACLDAMKSDKKVKAGRIRFILADRLGHVVIRDDVPDDVVKAAVESVCA